MSGLDLYAGVSYDAAKSLTMRYSSSFGLASRLFSPTIRPHIYAIYGMVRLADEIVDTYGGDDRATTLKRFHKDVLASAAGGFAANPILHAFGITARRFDITRDLIDPFFDSMSMDLTQTRYTRKQYESYIYGSAEVIGLMCLKVFCGGNVERYDTLAPGARLLGSAYQKVNFLRDFASDYNDRGRIYFPGVTIGSWNDATKNQIVTEIAAEFVQAKTAIKTLPATARTSVYLSFLYYRALLRRLESMSAQQILQERASIPRIAKLSYLVAAPIGVRLS